MILYNKTPKTEKAAAVREGLLGSAERGKNLSRRRWATIICGKQLPSRGEEGKTLLPKGQGRPGKRTWGMAIRPGPKHDSRAGRDGEGKPRGTKI